MTKRCSKFILATVLSLCLLLAAAVLCFNAPVGANAAETDSPKAALTLDAAEDFDTEGKVLTGLSETGKGKIASVDYYSVVLPEGLTEVGGNAFKDDTKLYSVTIPGSKLEWSDHDEDWYGGDPSYEVIGANAFSGCTALESVIFLSGENGNVEKIEPTLTTIGESAFANTALTSITIPSKQWTTLTIGTNAFDTATLKTVVLEGACSDFAWLCSANLTLKTLDISKCGFGLNSTETPAKIKFEDKSTVYLPEAGDIYYYFLTETLYMVSDAGAFVISDEFTSGMIANLTVENVKDSIVDYKHGSTGKVTFIEDLTDDDLQAVLDKVQKGDNYEVTTLTFVAIDTLGREFTMQQSKLVGKSFKWEFIDDEWAENANYSLPSEVQGVSVNPNKWTFYLDDDYYVNLGVHEVLKEQTLYQRIYAHIEVPTDTEITYSGTEYKLEGELAEAATITAIEDAAGNAVEKAIDAGTYTIHVALNNEDDDNSGDRGERVDRKKYIWAGAEWSMGDEDGKLEGAWVGIEYTDDDGNTRYKTQWATEYYAGGTLTDGKLEGATRYDFNAITPPPSTLYIGTWNETDGALENAVQVIPLYGNGCWSKDSFGEVTFELVISKKTTELVWRKGGEAIEDVNNFTLDYSQSNTADLFTALIGDESIVLTVGGGLAVTKGDEAYEDAVLEEGAYVFTASHKNYEFINSTFGVRINAQGFDLSENLSWTASGGTLTDGTVYIGKQGENTVIHTLPHPSISYTDVKEVKESIVRYTGNAITLSIAGDGYTSELADNVQTESGIYTATATLTANAGYRFTTSLEHNFAEHGITVTISADGKTAVVTKTWYIIELENELLDNEKSTAANSWIEYSIAGWTFGQNVTVGAPRLVHGDEDDDWMSNDNVTFDLIRDEVIIASGFDRSRFAYYINGSMPVGNYRLEASVNLVTVGDTHTHWWNGEQHDGTDDELMAHIFTRTYEFTVAAADMSLNAEKLISDTNGYDDYTWELTADADKELLFKDFADKINAEGAVSLTTVVRSGYWATEEANGYYGGHVVTYNLARMNNETYLEASDNRLLNRISSDLPDTYTVYFQVTAPNHNNLTDTGVEGRYAYYFTVVTYKTIDIPTVIDAGLVYTGSKVLPEIEESELYETVWSETDEYIVGGNHTVWFKLYDTVHYRWKGEDGDTVSVDFTVAKADNDFVVSLNMLGWNFETFDAAVNNIRAAAKFLDEGQVIHFKVTKKDVADALTGLGDFTVDEKGRVNQTVADILNALAVGDYTLYATVNGTDNYHSYGRDVDFHVEKAPNAWADGEDDLVLPSWIVGQYNEEENVIVINAEHGTVNIIITDLDGNEYYRRINGVVELDNLNDCAIGKYLVKAWVDETDDYTKLDERTFTIEVFKKAGMPWWAVLLIVIGSLGVAALILWILHEKGVLQMLTGKIVVAIRTKMTVDATIAAVRANKRAEESRKSIAKAEVQDRLEAMRKKAAEQRALPPEERAAALEERAAVEAARAEKAQQRADKLQNRADKLKGSDTVETPATLEAEPVETDTATEETTNPTDEE